MCALKSQIMSNASLKLFLRTKMWRSSAPSGTGLRNPLPTSPPPIGCSISFSVIPCRVGIKNFHTKSMFYMSHVIIHMKELKDIKCLRV